MTYEEICAQPSEQTLHQVEAKVAELRQRLAALGELDDVPNTPRAQEIFWRDRSMYDGRIRTLLASAETLSSVEPHIEVLRDWLAQQTKWRATCCDKFLPMHPHRDPAYQSVKLSILALDKGLGTFHESEYCLETSFLGELMRRDGYVESAPEANTNAIRGRLPWIGSMADVERHLKTLREQRFEARKRIAADAKFDEGRVAVGSDAATA